MCCVVPVFQVYREMFTDATPERTERMFHYLDADNTGYIDYLGWSQTVKLQVRLLSLLPLQLAADVVCGVRPTTTCPQAHCSYSKACGWLLSSNAKHTLS